MAGAPTGLLFQVVGVCRRCAVGTEPIGFGVQSGWVGSSSGKMHHLVGEALSKASTGVERDLLSMVMMRGGVLYLRCALCGDE